MSYYPPQAEQNTRQRPLQKSMFLPDNYQKQQQIPQPKQHNADYIHYNPLKRSSIPIIEGIHQSNSSSSIHYNHISHSYTPHHNTGVNISTQNINEQRTIIPQEHYQLNFTNNSKGFSNIAKQQGMNESTITNISKIQKMQLGQAKNNTSLQYVQLDYLNPKIMAQISEKLLPKLISQIKKQLHKQILGLKQQVQNLKSQMKQTNEKQQYFNLQIKSQTGNIINFNNNNINNINNINTKAKKEESQIKQLEKSYGFIEKKFSHLEAKISQNLMNLNRDIEKLSLKIDDSHKQKSFKVSQIKSTLPPIMLQYKQCFTIKRNNSQSNIQTNPNNGDEIIINRYQYFIDRNGYLLDQERRYLTDLRGNQIRLEQKHLKLLEQNKIINK